jgi:hypothetical protein
MGASHICRALTWPGASNSSVGGSIASNLWVPTETTSTVSLLRDYAKRDRKGAWRKMIYQFLNLEPDGSGVFDSLGCNNVYQREALGLMFAGPTE